MPEEIKKQKLAVMGKAKNKEEPDNKAKKREELTTMEAELLYMMKKAEKQKLAMMKKAKTQEFKRNMFNGQKQNKMYN